MGETDGYHLAQVNIALPQAPLDSEQLAGFVERLEPVNALADAATGFVWRLQTEDGDATGIRAFGDDRLIVNMSVWSSLEALRQFVYRSGHADVLRRRKEWFESMPQLISALWWIPAGSTPTLAEAEARLEHLRQHGPSAPAFTFKDPFPVPAGVPSSNAGQD